MSTHHVIKSLPITTFLSHTGPDGARNLLARDRARASKLLAGLHPSGPRIAFDNELVERRRRTKSKSGPTVVTGEEDDADAATDAATDPDSVDVTDAGVTYTMQVGIGSPATDYTLLIDTGSSNTWVGAGKKYVQTETSQRTNARVSVSYGSGNFSGNEFVDEVTLAPGLVIEKQSIGVASSSQGFQGVDGILGIGPVDLTQSTLSTNQLVPTVTDNLFSQKTIPTNSIGISFEPSTASPDTPDAPGVMNGELTFGGTDDSRFTGTISYVPVTSTSPASSFWGIDQTITYGSATGGTQILKKSSGIVDTGTTLLLLATDAFQAYQRTTGATIDNSTGLLTLSQSQFNKLKSLFFHIGNATFELTPNAQIWPRSLNSTIGGHEGKIYLVTADMGSLSGAGLDFINGFAFLQRFYSVYDTGNSRVGLANTQFTTATTN